MKQKGFTLVEILIAVVVIAILGAISVVGYGHITTNAQDGARRAAAHEVRKAMETLSIKKSVTVWGSAKPLDQATGLCPEPDGYSGSWNANTYVADKYNPGWCTPGDMLVAAGLLSSDFWDKIPKSKEPNRNSRMLTQMLTSCRSRGATELYLFYYVKNTNDQEKSLMGELKRKCRHLVHNAENVYKMRGVIKVN